MNQEELKQRTKAFAVRIVRLVEALPPTPVGRTFANQIVRSGTSVAAKLGIVIEEADETAFWLEMIIEAGIVPKDRIDSLLQEANELVAIFVSSRKTVSSSLKSNHKSSIDNRRS